MFGEDEILVPACQLTDLPGVHQGAPAGGVTYIHLLLDHHAIIFAEDTPTETMFLGKQTHQMLSDRELDEINTSLPSETVWNMQPARLFVRGKRLRKLLERHENNNKPLISGDVFAHQGSDQALSA
jgi:D-serine dehydratase